MFASHATLDVSRVLVITLVIGMLAGCAEVLPAQGPSADSIAQAATTVSETHREMVNFEIVNVSAATLPAPPPRQGWFSEAFRNQTFRTDNETIQASDKLEIRIWEVAEDGLFATAGNRVTVMETDVSNTGMIEVPYAGQVKASGLTTSTLREVLIERYRGQAIEPEIAVRITQTNSRAVSVLGAVKNPSRNDVPSRGLRLMELLAAAGGSPYSNWEVKITIQRGSKSSSAFLQEVVDNPSNNIVVLPGDTMQVTYIPRRFAVYGAVNNTGNIEMPVLQPNLASLLSAAGGLNDMLAEPASVFIFRYRGEGDTGTNTPAIAYRLDFAKPDAFLLADRFKLRSDDIVYVATADASEFSKFVTMVLSPFFGTTTRVQNVTN